MGRRSKTPMKPPVAAAPAAPDVPAVTTGGQYQAAAGRDVLRTTAARVAAGAFNGLPRPQVRDTMSRIWGQRPKSIRAALQRTHTSEFRGDWTVQYKNSHLPQFVPTARLN